MISSFLLSGRAWAMACSSAALLSGLLTGCSARTFLVAGEKTDGTSGAEVVPPRFDCRVSDSPRPMLAARAGPGLFFAYPDRTVKEVFVFDLPQDMYVTDAGVIARGDRVAAYIIADALGSAPEPPPFAEAVVVDVDGTVLYHQRHDFAYEGWGADSRIAGNADGLFVLTLMEVQANLGLVIEGGEVHTFPERMAGRSDPDPQGRMVVWNAEASSSSDLYFFDTAADTFTPSRYVADYSVDAFGSSPAVLASGILYIARNPTRLVFEDASGTSELRLDVDLEYPGHATPGFAASGGYTVFMLGGTTPLDARYLATHFASGEAREFRLSPPAGYQPPGDYWNPPPIDAGGRLLIPLAGNQRNQLYATKDGGEWEPLGRPIAASGYPTRTVEAGGTVIFEGWGSSPDVPGTLPAWAAQVIGPQGGEGIELIRSDPGAPDNPFYADDEISADGACVAYFRSGTLHVMEVADYTISDLGLPANGQSAEMAWIPDPQWPRSHGRGRRR